jgi:hypothetical protein
MTTPYGAINTEQLASRVAERLAYRVGLAQNGRVEERMAYFGFYECMALSLGISFDHLAETLDKPEHSTWWVAPGTCTRRLAAALDDAVRTVDTRRA